MFKKLRRIAVLLLAFTTLAALPAAAYASGWKQDGAGDYYYLNYDGSKMVNSWILYNGCYMMISEIIM